MCRRLIFLISIVLVLGLVNGASADIITWTDDEVTNSSWCDKNNWLTGTENEVPGSSDTAVIATPERGPIIGIGCNVDVGTIQGPAWAVATDQVMDINTSGTVSVDAWAADNDGTGTVTININGSPTITIGGDYWRLADNGTAIINISGDPCIIVAGDMRGSDNAGTFIVNMSGGHLEVGDDMYWGDVGGGELNLSGGDIIIAEDFAFGSLRGSALITLNMTGGSISIADVWEFPSNKDRAGAVTANLDAGVIECNEFVHGSIIEGKPSFTDDWHVNIEEGVLKIRGDVTAAIDVNVAAGQITAYDGDGTVNVELVDGNTVVTGLPPDPNTATKPNPPKYSEQVEPDVVVSWTSGINAATVGGHDVYFGTDFDDVNEGSGSTFMGNQDANTFDTINYDPCGLEFETTYYWRIDEVNDGNMWTGRVWYFTTRGPISDPHLLVWYKFDETDSNTAYDSSGHGNHGPIGLDDEKIVQAPTWNPDDGHPHDGGCLVFNDDMVVQPPATLLSNIGGGITFSVWLKDTTVGGNNWVFDAGGGEGAARHLCASVPYLGSDVYWRAGDDTNDVCVWTTANPVEWMGSWRHFVFVKDENAGKMRIYYEGKLVAEQPGVIVGTLADFRDKSLKVGTATWENFDYEGAMDDFRVYDRALSETEIAALFRGGELGVAWSPDPSDGAIDVPRDVVLTWKPGNYAQVVNAHDVYFGTSFNDVNDANTTETLDVYKGSPDLDANSYTPGILELDTTYYWRIDEVNDPCVWKGVVWRFTVANFLIVDDMEDYNDIKPDRILDTWHDWSHYDPVGGKYPTAAELTLETAEADVHGGRQSMKFQYNNSDIGAWMFYRNISEIDANTIGPLMHLEIGQDWTILGMKILTLHFIGHPDNDATEQMYVALADSAGHTAVVPYGYYIDEDMNDIKKREWQEWNIALEDFNDINDVDVTDVNNVYIGFGNRDNPTVGGSGVVFFDDIRLHPAKCIPIRRQPPDFDFSNNCIVDIEDVEIMADDWLDYDEFVTAVTPDPCVAHYKFDGNVEDSSGNNHHGTVIGGTAVYTGGKYNDCLDFDEEFGVEIPSAVFSDVNEAITISVWVNGHDQNDVSNVILQGGAGPSGDDPYIVSIYTSWLDDGKVGFRTGWDEVDVLPFYAEDWAEQWNHYAFTKNATESTQRIYVNSRLVAEKTDANAPMSGVEKVRIGMAPDRLGDIQSSRMDDVRIYDYALSEAEVAWLATGGTGYVELMSPANISDEEDPGEKKVNFKDYAKLTDKWLEEKMWPPE